MLEDLENVWLCVSYLQIFFVLCLIAVLMSSEQLVLDRVIRINCNSSESIVFEMPHAESTSIFLSCDWLLFLCFGIISIMIK